MQSVGASRPWGESKLFFIFNSKNEHKVCHRQPLLHSPSIFAEQLYHFTELHRGLL